MMKYLSSGLLNHLSLIRILELLQGIHILDEALASRSA